MIAFQYKMHRMKNKVLYASSSLGKTQKDTPLEDERVQCKCAVKTCKENMVTKTLYWISWAFRVTDRSNGRKKVLLVK